MSNTSQIESRLRRMERKMRFFQGMTLVLILLVGLLVSSSFRSAELIPDVMRAKRFEVVDDDGNPLLVLRKNKTSGNYDAGVAESFYENGKVLWYLGKGKDTNAARLELGNKEGNVMHRMGMDDDQAPYHAWYNRDGKRVGLMGVGRNTQVGSIWLFEKDGETRKLILTECSDGQGCICVYNQNGSDQKCYGYN